MQHRRSFLRQAGILTLAGALPHSVFSMEEEEQYVKFPFAISLAEWSLHRTLFAGKMTNLDFPVVAKKDFGISIVEYVNQFFKDKAKDTAYLKELMMRCDDNGVSNHLIMCDGEGNLGSKDEAARKQAVENHYKWVEAAKFLGCKTIRVNAGGEGSYEEVMKQATDGLRRLSEFAATMNINVIVENHGGFSSNGQWLAAVMRGVGLKNCGTLPDFGNFCIKPKPDWKGCDEEYDRYQGVKEILPFAKGISAKTMAFDAKGNCVETDYKRMMKIIKQGGFKGIIGIESSGDGVSEMEGIRLTKVLLEKFRK